MIDRTHELPVKRQAQLLDISRGTVYYQREPVNQTDLSLMRRIDELHLEHPFAGSRMLRDMLGLAGIQVGRTVDTAADSVRIAAAQPRIGGVDDRMDAQSCDVC